MFKEQKGITLVALVITIIVLLILAGVSISLVVGDQGILTRAQDAVGGTEQATADQEIQLAMDSAQMAYTDAWTGDQSVQKIDYYKDLAHYQDNCVSAAQKAGKADVKVYVNDAETDNTKPNVAVTYLSKSNVTYVATFNANKPSTTYSITALKPNTAYEPAQGFEVSTLNSNDSSTPTPPVTPTEP